MPANGTHPAITSGRLALYLHACIHHDPDVITSAELGEAADVNSTQVRRDLSEILGRSGKRGVGYRTTLLLADLTLILGNYPAELDDLARVHRGRAKALTAVAKGITGRAA